MKKTDPSLEEMEQRLRKARPVELSAEFRTRTMAGAQGTWAHAPAEVPWQIPLRNLALAAAAAGLIVAFADLFVAQVTTPRPSLGPAATGVETADLDALLDVLTSPRGMRGNRHLALGLGPWGSTSTARPALLDYVEQVRQALREAEQSANPSDPPPIQRDSRLAPDRRRHYC
jgi:hypothetical protein